jgi:hypothetical protein
MEKFQGPANQGDNYHSPISGGIVGGRNNLNIINNGDMYHYHISNRTDFFYLGSEGELTPGQQATC